MRQKRDRCGLPIIPAWPMAIIVVMVMVMVMTVTMAMVMRPMTMPVGWRMRQSRRTPQQ